jgi:disulfide oxidoreductase YuzD
MKIHCTRLKGFKYAAWENGFVETAKRELTAAGGLHEVVARPEQADMILVFESNNDKTCRDIARYERDPLVRRYPERLFTINYEPTPAGFLPGLYTGLTPVSRDPSRHRGWSYLFPPLPAHLLRQRADSIEPTLLFSFRGARSHPIRERLLDSRFQCGQPFRITYIDRWFDHTKDEQKSYVQEILSSHFVLCPRGLSPSSHRCYEVMSLGRCPVIISDDWIAPRTVDWDTCSVRVREADLDRLPEILTQRLPEARAMGAAARIGWERWFGHAKRFEHAVEELLDLQRSRPADHDESAFRRQWRSPEFYAANNWTPPTPWWQTLCWSFKR